MHILTSLYTHAAVQAAAIPEPKAPSFLNMNAVWGLLTFVAVLILARNGLASMNRHGKEGNIKAAGNTAGATMIGALMLAVAAGFAVFGALSGFFGEIFNA
ncbi:MAG: hypothetical protein ACRCZP_11645 [Phycicoccus sp.]